MWRVNVVTLVTWYSTTRNGIKKLGLIEQDNLAKAIINSKTDTELYKKNGLSENYDDFLTILNSLQLILQNCYWKYIF